MVDEEIKADTDKKEYGDFEDLKESADKRKSTTKTVEFNHNGKKFKFVVRPLSSKESSMVETKATYANRDEQGLDMWKFRVETLKAGIVKSPSGFAPTESKINKLPTYMVDGLVDKIQEMSGMADSDKRGFQEIRER